MSSLPYVPTDVMPYFANSGDGPLELQEDGDVIQEVETYQANAPINSISNTTPIVVETTVPHYFQNATKIIISGSAVAAANNSGTPWAVTILTATTFSLTGSTAGGAGGAQGTAISTKQGTLGKLIDAANMHRKTLGIAVGSAYTGAAAFPGTVSTVGTLTIPTLAAVGGTFVTMNDPIVGANSTVYVQADRFYPISNPDIDDDSGTNVLTAPDIPKAWGLLLYDGAGGVEVVDGRNIDGVAVAAANRGWTVTLERGLENQNYAVDATYQVSVGSPAGQCWVPQVNVTANDTFDIYLQRSTTEAYVDFTGMDVYYVSFKVMGRQVFE